MAKPARPAIGTAETDSGRNAPPRNGGSSSEAVPRTIPAAWRDVLAVLVLLAAVLTVYAPALAPGRTFLPADLLLLTPALVAPFPGT